MRPHPFILTSIALGAAGAVLLAHAEGVFNVAWFTFDGGGGASNGGEYVLTGTIGQPDAGLMAGGDLELAGGFWRGGDVPVTVEDDLPGGDDPPETDGLPAVPTVFQVHRARPNPFNPVTTIGYDLPTTSDVRIEIYNILGRLVDVLVDDAVAAGRHRVMWDGRGRDGSEVGSGVYIVRTSAGRWSSRQKITLLK